MISKILATDGNCSLPFSKNLNPSPTDKSHLNRSKHVAPTMKCTGFSALLCLYDRWHLGVKGKEAKHAVEAEFQHLFDFIITS